MPLRWHGIIGSVGIIAVVATTGVIGTGAPASARSLQPTPRDGAPPRAAVGDGLEDGNGSLSHPTIVDCGDRYTRGR
jgi:hypothetical protein